MRDSIVGRLATSILAITLWVLASSSWVMAESPVDAEISQLKELIVASEYEDVLNRGALLLETVTAEDPAQPLQEAVILGLMVNAAYRCELVMEERFLGMAQRAVELTEKFAGPEDLATATSLMHQANLYSCRSEYSLAVPGHTRAIVILADLGPEHDQQRAVLLSSLGVVLRRLGQYRQAQQQYEEALVLQENLLGPEHPDVATSYNNLSLVVRLSGEYRYARELLLKALAIREAYFGPNHEWVGETLNNLSTVAADLGAYDESLKYQERAVEVLRITLGEDHQRYWWTRLNLGVAYIDMGDHTSSLPICLEVLTALQEIYGAEHVDTTYALDAIGSCYYKSGQYEKALGIFTESQRLIEQSIGVDNVEAAPTMFQVGRCQAACGELQLGADTMARSLAIQQNSAGENASDTSDLLHRLAEVYLRMERPADALGFVRQSQKLLKITVGTEHPLYAEATLLKAQSMAALGQVDKAVRLAVAAEDISRRHLQVTMRVLSEARALAYAASRVQGLDVALSLLPSGTTSPQVAQVWDALIKSRAVVLDEFTARNTTLSSHASPAAVALLDSSLAIREELANLTLRGAGNLDATSYIQAMAESREKLDQLDHQLSRVDTRSGAARQNRSTGQVEVQAQLQPGTALVSYVLYRRPVGDPVDARQRDHFMAIVATGSGDPIAVELGPAADVTEQVEQWREQIIFGSQIMATVSSRGLVQVNAGEQEDLESYQSSATILRQMVWDPLTPYLAGNDRVFIVPTGVLHGVNFGSLPAESGLFMAEEGPLLHTLLTERSLVQSAQQGEPRSGVLAIGDPQFGDRSDKPDQVDAPCSDLTSLYFPPLPHARQEVEQLVDIWQRSGKGTQDVVKVLTGAEATEQAFKDNLEQHGIIHLATHGFVLENSCSRKTELPARLTHALDLSGLAMQGANEWVMSETGDKDGILTASEITALDMSGVDWAVLSACDTGRGAQIARSEGVFGLCRAFAVAGARTIIVSLWPVGDETARDWMENLYTSRLVSGLNTAQSVQSAHRAVLAQRRSQGLSVHPYYWAGFTAVGGWQ